MLEINRFLKCSSLPFAPRWSEKWMLENDDSQEHIEDLFHAVIVIEVFCIHSGHISQDPGSAVSAAWYLEFNLCDLDSVAWQN